MESNGDKGITMPTSQHSEYKGGNGESWRPVFTGFPEFSAPALCAQADPEEWFPEKGGSTREAKKVCGSCLARTECLQYALEHGEVFGVWGGLSARERRRAAGLTGLPPTAQPVRASAPEPAPDRGPRRVLKPAERELVARRTRQGWNAQQIAIELGVSTRTVVRVRSEQRTSSPATAALSMGR